MNNYFAVRVDVEPASADITDLMAAFMADAGFESFEPDDKGLTAYIREEAGDAEALTGEALSDFPFDVNFNISSEWIKGEDWNQEWEKNYFKPIVIAGECVIHSSFHTDVPEGKFDIVIDPKMAFGTGHHDTTSQMVRHILNSDLKGKRVIDMGTGTGILAILAAMREASHVVGIEIDTPAWENAVENVALNGVEVDMINSDASALKNIAPSDYFFANINRNIILQDFESYAAALNDNGEMFLSGFYEEDVPMIMQKAESLGFHEEGRLVSNRWTALRIKR